MLQFKSTDFSVLIQPSYGPTLTSIHDYIALTIGVFVCNVLSLLFTTLSRFAIAFLPSSKRLYSRAAVTLHVCSDASVMSDSL